MNASAEITYSDCPGYEQWARQASQTPSNKMFTASQRLVTPRDIARIFFRQWRKIAIFFGGVLAATLLIIALYPRSYASEAKLLIRVGRETVGLDPTATTGVTIML